MCIFSQPVVSVSDTNIFARFDSDGWQYLVYQMQFETVEPNAMVLPLPIRLPCHEQDSLEFISLKDYEAFFTDLDKGFPLARVPSNKIGRARGSAWATDSKLKVHEVGDFIASFVPTISDFGRLDEQFRVPRESCDKFPAYSDYGFAVFQLQSREGKPHPMAFRFRSRLNSSPEATLFFPTVHIHDGEVHPLEDFDHTLYLQAREFDQACGEYQLRRQLVADPATGYVRSKWSAGDFCDTAKCQGIVDKDALVHRRQMRGRLKNEDVLASLDLTQVDQQSWNTPVRNWPVLAGLVGSVVGLSWFFNRRNTIAAGPLAESRTPIDSTNSE